MSRDYINKLVQLMQDNPSLPVMCKVDSDIVVDDGYMWWLGKINERYESEVDCYSINKYGDVIFRSSKEYTEWIGDFYDVEDFKEVPDDEWEEFCKKKVEEVANLEKAIFISITTR